MTGPKGVSLLLSGVCIKGESAVEDGNLGLGADALQLGGWGESHGLAKAGDDGAWLLNNGNDGGGLGDADNLARLSYQATWQSAIANRCFCAQAATTTTSKLPGLPYAEVQGDERSEEHVLPGRMRRCSGRVMARFSL